MVSAASFKLSKMPDMSSGISPMTKQLNRVTMRSVPAPEMMRPAGRNLKFVSASRNCGAQVSGSSSRAAKAVATRSQVSSMVLSTGRPSGDFSRYFMSQICWEMAAIGVVVVVGGMGSLPGAVLAGFLLGYNVRLAIRYVPSELNMADGPSRGAAYSSVDNSTVRKAELKRSTQR